MQNRKAASFVLFYKRNSGQIFEVKILKRVRSLPYRKKRKVRSRFQGAIVASALLLKTLRQPWTVARWLCGKLNYSRLFRGQRILLNHKFWIRPLVFCVLTSLRFFWRGLFVFSDCNAISLFEIVAKIFQVKMPNDRVLLW